MDSLYVPQCSPIAALRAVYKGSRSIRWGTWPDLENDFATVGADELIVFGGNMGVVEIGRLRAVGSISPGIATSDLIKNP